ncbi:MAG: leucine-rich repeat domain-containing protein [Prevotellaceae bacterium]|nr:leucine-rich repeat domain-containing protein [Prevotellaceae bacterium]
MTSVNIGNSVTSIGKYAFADCSGLTSVNIPNSVTKIGEYAFAYCSGLTSVTLPDSLTSIPYMAFENCSKLSRVVWPSECTSFSSYPFSGCSYNLAFYAKRGTKGLLALWKGGCDKVRDVDSKIQLPCPTFEKVSSTQRTITMKATNLYDEYRFYYKDNGEYKETHGENIMMSDLRPQDNYTYTLYIALGDMLDDTSSPFYIEVNNKFATASIYPSLSIGGTASSLSATGTYVKGDADVTEQTIAVYKGKSTNSTNLVARISGNKYSMTNLNPQETYTFVYKVITNGWSYSTTEERATASVKLTTLQPKVVSLGNVIVAAQSNLDEEETNVGFEWRRTDWSDDFASNTGGAYIYNGTMEGYIRNLNTEKLWKYRPYYLSPDGRYYYGDWVGLDPSNTSYFEPTVHTYASINVEGNTALVKGYAMTGTDKITSQGFKYWKSVSVAGSNAWGASTIATIPGDALIVEADGQVMTANLTGLDYNATYHYVAFATTSEGDTYYGEEQVFSTGDDPTGIGEMSTEPIEHEPATIVARYDLNGRRLDAPQHGLNILRMSDGSVKKVYVK